MTVRVGMLAPMKSELEPLVEQIGMNYDGEFWRGHVGDVEVVALLTTMGMAAGERGATRMLEVGVDRVVVSGVCGGVDRDRVKVGDLLVPATVFDRRTGTAYGPPVSPHIAPNGTISCGDDLLTEPGTLEAMAGAGILAVDMETAAVAAVCEGAGVAWSAFRGVSDLAGDPFIDDAFFALANPDGTIDPPVLAAYLAEDPARVEWLTRMAPGAAAATRAAATAAIRSCIAV